MAAVSSTAALAAKSATPATVVGNGEEMVETFHTHVTAIGAPSAGSIQASRLVAPTEEHVFVAVRNQLYFLNLGYPAAPSFKAGRQGPRISSPVGITDYSVTALPLTTLSELQSIDIVAEADGTYRSAVSDSLGRTTVAAISINTPTHITGKRRRVDDSSDSKITADTDGSAATVIRQYHIGPHLPQETGWSGAVLHPSDAARVATVGYFSRRLDFWQNGSVQRSIHTPLNPTQIRYTTIPASATPLLTITEQNIVSVWDERTSENNGCVQRLARSQAPLYTLCSHPSGLIASGGEEKTIYVYDVRSWKLVGSWPKVMKYEIVATSFALRDPSYCYVTGLDHEVFCGKWESALGGSGADVDRKFHSTLKRHGFRGDSRWIGIDRVTNSETLIGVTEAANLYVLREPHRMLSAAERAASNSTVASMSSSTSGLASSSPSANAAASLRSAMTAEEKKAKADQHRAAAAERKAALANVMATNAATAAASGDGKAPPSRKQAKKLAKAELKAAKKAEHGAKRKANEAAAAAAFIDGNYRHSNANDRAAREQEKATATTATTPSPSST